MAVLKLRLGGEHEEMRDIDGHPVDRGGRPVRIFDQIVGERRRHGDPVAREIHVVVLVVAHLHAFRRVGVTGQHGGDIVRPGGLVLGDQAEVGRQGAAVCGLGGIVVRKGRDEAVRELAGPLEHLAFLIRPVHYEGVRRLGPGRGLGHAHLHEVAVEHQPHAVAGGADLAIDLVAALEGSAVECAENAVEAPLPLRRFRTRPGGRGGAGQDGETESGGQRGAEKPVAHHALSIAPDAPAGGDAPPPSTGSPMLSGSGRGRSNTESSGRITKKWAK